MAGLYTNEKNETPLVTCDCPLRGEYVDHLGICAVVHGHRMAAGIPMPVPKRRPLKRRRPRRAGRQAAA